MLIGLVLTEIQAFKNVKNLQRNVWKSGQIRTSPDKSGLVPSHSRYEIRQLEDLTSHETRTAEGFVMFSFGK